MKQIDECLTRAFNNKEPLASKKWKAFIGTDKKTHCRVLILFHYHHLVLRYNLDVHEVKYEWWEKPADKRGLDSAKAWLEERRKNLTNPA